MLFFKILQQFLLPSSFVFIFKNKKETNSIPCPADFKIENSYDILDFFPDAKNLKKSDLAFHEYFGILYYRFFKY